MTLTKKDVAVPKAAICFGCNQPFEGNPVGRQFRSDLLSPTSQGELAGLYFHPGHLLRYARRRNWTPLVDFLEANGPSNY